jgi:hypothetical protein
MRLFGRDIAALAGRPILHSFGGRKRNPQQRRKRMRILVCGGLAFLQPYLEFGFSPAVIDVSGCCMRLFSKRPRKGPSFRQSRSPLVQLECTPKWVSQKNDQNNRKPSIIQRALRFAAESHNLEKRIWLFSQVLGQDHVHI